MKICKDCNENKPFTQFVPKASCKDGYELRCRQCRTIRYNKADPIKAFKKIYLSQCTHSVTRGHPQPTYTFDQLLDWVDKQPNALRIWDMYVKSGYASDARPSVDRLNDNLPYTLDNIQLLTWSGNRAKGANDKKQGVNNSCNRAVIAYNLDGTIYKKYYSISQAMREIGGNSWGIVTVADGKPVKDGRGKLYIPATYKGLKWSWA